MTLWPTVLIAIYMMVGSVFAQSLRDRAKQEGGNATTIIDADYGIMTLSELISESDLVLRGRITGMTPHLRADESAVVTDYLIAPLDVIRQRRQVSVSRPGESTQIVIRRPGGSVAEAGLTFSTAVNVYPESESFKVGDEVVVFLQYDVDLRIYHFTGGPFGAFRVDRGRISPMTQAVAQRRGDTPMDVDRFLNRLPRGPR